MGSMVGLDGVPVKASAISLMTSPMIMKELQSSSCHIVYPPTPLPCLRGRRKGRAKHGLDSTAAVDPVSQVPFRPRAVRTGRHRLRFACGRVVRAFGLFGSVANELHFCHCAGCRTFFAHLCAHLLRSAVLYLSVLKHRVDRLQTYFFLPSVCFKAPCGQVANVLFFALPELGLCWRLAFSDPLPTSFIFVSVQVRLPHDFCPPMCSPSCRCAFVPTCWASCLFL